MSGFVFHFTDTARLPWILQSGGLRPGCNRIGGFPDPDFLWATTDALGDRTASSNLDGYRSGKVRRVRVVLPAALFEPWHEIVECFPAWTPDQVARLERLAAGKSDPRTWRCRADPVPLGECDTIETRGFTDGRWRRLDEPFRIMPLDEKSLGVVIGSKIYVSTVFTGPAGSVGYVPTILDTGERAA